MSGTGGSRPRCNQAIAPTTARLRRQVSGLAVWHPKMPWGVYFSTMQFSRDCAQERMLASSLSLVIPRWASIWTLELHIEGNCTEQAPVPSVNLPGGFEPAAALFLSGGAHLELHSQEAQHRGAAYLHAWPWRLGLCLPVGRWEASPGLLGGADGRPCLQLFSLLP